MDASLMVDRKGLWFRDADAGESCGWGPEFRWNNVRVAPRLSWRVQGTVWGAEFSGGSGAADETVGPRILLGKRLTRVCFGVEIIEMVLKIGQVA